MKWNEYRILEVLDKCAESFTFPALDNGYVYMASTRLSLYRSEGDWGLVIEVFGFSPRSGIPDTQVYSFSNKIRRGNDEGSFVTNEVFENHLNNNPYNEISFVYPIDNDSWINEEDCEYANESAVISLRGMEFIVPSVSELTAAGIKPEEQKPLVFEVCRWLALEAPSKVLASEVEQRKSLAVNVSKILELTDWGHPDVTRGELPSESKCFQQLATVLATGDTSSYRPDSISNTHWSHWPEGGSL